jgi:hypothetical protein
MGKCVSVPNLSRGRKKRKAMKKTIRRAVMAALIFAASATAVTALMPAQAAVPTPKGKEAAKPAGPSVRSAIGKALNDAMKATDAKDYVTALAKVKEADAVMDKTPWGP